MNKEAIQATIDVMRSFLEIIRHSRTLGPGQGIPNGYLYSIVMDKMSLEVYSAIIEKMKDMRLIEEKHKVLRIYPDETKHDPISEPTFDYTPL